jgi:hypothetical protein
VDRLPPERWTDMAGIRTQEKEVARKVLQGLIIQRQDERWSSKPRQPTSG